MWAPSPRKVEGAALVQLSWAMLPEEKLRRREVAWWTLAAITATGTRFVPSSISHRKCPSPSAIASASLGDLRRDGTWSEPWVSVPFSGQGCCTSPFPVQRSKAVLRDTQVDPLSTTCILPMPIMYNGLASFYWSRLITLIKKVTSLLTCCSLETKSPRCLGNSLHLCSVEFWLCPRQECTPWGPGALTLWSPRWSGWEIKCPLWVIRKDNTMLRNYSRNESPLASTLWFLGPSTFPGRDTDP